MKLFGEFLVEQKLIGTDVLADALVEQVRGMPSYVELAWRNKLVSSEAILSLLKLQTGKRIGFMEASRELGLWSLEFEKTLLEDLGSIRIPLGQILVSRGVLTLEAITHALDEYLSTVKGPSAGTEEVPASTSREEAPPAEPGNNCEIFCETFGSELKEKLVNLTERFATADDVTKTEVKDFFDGVHAIRGASRLAGLAKSEELCGLLEDGLLILLAASQAYPPDLLRSLGRASRAWCDLFWDLRENLAKGESEGPFFSQSEIRDQLGKLDGLLALLKFDADMAGLGGGAGQ